VFKRHIYSITVSVYLAVCAIYRDEAPYLREWIEFHRLVGAERFFLYDNRSRDDHRAVLAPYVSGGIVELIDWPQFPGQCAAFSDCLERHRDDARWIAFLDIDEFLFSPTFRPLPQILSDYEQYPGVGVNFALFGSSGHKVAPAGLVIENYRLRASDDRGGTIKSVVDPRRALHNSAGGTNPHAFVYRDGLAVNEQMKPIGRPRLSHSAPVSYSRLRINHYCMKSEQQFRRKLQQPLPHNGKLRPIHPEGFALHDARCSTVTDETLLAYAPAVRRALARPASAVTVESLAAVTPSRQPRPARAAQLP
jgi:hypothetical protein